MVGFFTKSESAVEKLKVRKVLLRPKLLWESAASLIGTLLMKK